MAQPTPYTRQYNLASVQSGNSLIPIPGSYLDAELDAVKNTLDQTLANLALIQRDDGALKNGIVGVASLSADVKALMAAGANIEGPWVTATVYEVGAIVESSAIAYMCLVEHTSGTFATDLSNSKWVALTSSALNDGSVTTAKIADLNVTTAKLANDAVTFAKLQNITSDRLLGRDTASSGDAEEITVSGGLEWTGSGGIQRSALTGDVTASAGSGSTTIANGAVTYAKLQDISATQRLLGRNTAGAGDPEEVSLPQALDWLSNSQGAVLYRGASAWAALAPGTSGQFLQTQGAGANPAWASGGKLVQAVAVTLNANQDHTATIPWDDSIPQSGEGSEIGSFNPTITPTNSSNILEVDVTVMAEASGAVDASDAFILALFKQGETDARAAVWGGPGSSNAKGTPLRILYRMPAGTTSAVEFRCRIGRNSGGLVSVNGAAAVRKLGGVSQSIIVVREIAA